MENNGQLPEDQIIPDDTDTKPGDAGQFIEMQQQQESVPDSSEKMPIADDALSKLTESMLQLDDKKGKVELLVDLLSNAPGSKSKLVSKLLLDKGPLKPIGKLVEQVSDLDGDGKLNAAEQIFKYLLSNGIEKELAQTIADLFHREKEEEGEDKKKEEQKTLEEEEDLEEGSSFGESDGNHDTSPDYEGSSRDRETDEREKSQEEQVEDKTPEQSDDDQRRSNPTNDSGEKNKPNGNQEQDENPNIPDDEMESQADHDPDIHQKHEQNMIGIKQRSDENIKEIEQRFIDQGRTEAALEQFKQELSAETERCKGELDAEVERYTQELNGQTPQAPVNSAVSAKPEEGIPDSVAAPVQQQGQQREGDAVVPAVSNPVPSEESVHAPQPDHLSHQSEESAGGQNDKTPKMEGNDIPPAAKEEESADKTDDKDLPPHVKDGVDVKDPVDTKDLDNGKGPTGPTIQ